MKKTSLNKFVYLILICALFIKIQSVFAAQTFQNNLLKTDLYKSSLGGVKLTLYTNKPYTDAVVVNKKSDSEYVILLPETSNSLTAKPSTASVSDVIRNVEVKTQQYANQVKGYTKITISTSRPVEITPQVQVLNPLNQLTENDYKELLSQAVKKKNLSSPAVVKPAVKPVINPVVKYPAKPLTKPVPTAKNEAIKSEQKSTAKMPTLILGKNQKTPSLKPSLSLPAKTQKTMSLKPSSSLPVKTQKPVLKAPVQQKVVTPVVEKTLPKPSANQIATSQPEVQTQTPVVQPQIQTPAPQAVEPEVSTPVASPVMVPPTEKKFGRFHKYKILIKNNLYALAGIMLAGFILLLIAARKINKNSQKQKEIFKTHLNEKPMTAKDYTENISEDMTWKEKFQTYVEASAQPAEAQSVDEQVLPADFVHPPSADSIDELDELFFTPPSKENENIEPIAEQSDLTENEPIYEESIPEKLSEEAITEEEPFEESDTLKYYESQDEDVIGVSQIDDLFGEDVVEESAEDENFEFDEDEDLYEDQHEITSEIEPQDEIVRSQFSIDEDKGFYLVDFEDTTALVGHIDEEIFVIKRFDKKIDAPLQARLDQKNGSSTNYMTKVGSFRALVEVTPKNMNLLIEL